MQTRYVLRRRGDQGVPSRGGQGRSFGQHSRSFLGCEPLKPAGQLVQDRPHQLVLRPAGFDGPGIVGERHAAGRSVLRCCLGHKSTVCGRIVPKKGDWNLGSLWEPGFTVIARGGGRRVRHGVRTSLDVLGMTENQALRIENGYHLAPAYLLAIKGTNQIRAEIHCKGSEIRSRSTSANTRRPATERREFADAQAVAALEDAHQLVEVVSCFRGGRRPGDCGGAGHLPLGGAQPGRGGASRPQ